MARKAHDPYQWKEAPSDLNLWDPSKPGSEVVGLLMSVNPEGTFGLQVRVRTPDGNVLTLPAHKVLQSRLEAIAGEIIPGKSVLRITYQGTQKSRNWPTPMRMYKVEYRERATDDIF